MGSAYLFYWLEEKKISCCPKKIRDFIENCDYPENDFKISYGTADNLKKPLEEVIKISKEVFFFPVVSEITEENIGILKRVSGFIANYKAGGKLIHIIPLVFIKNSLLTKSILQQINKLSGSKLIRGIFLITDKFRNNIDVKLPVDWLVMFKNFVEFIYAYRKSRDLKLNDMQGIVCFGSTAIELPIRQNIDKTLLELFKEFKEKQLKPSSSSFDFNLTQTTTPFEVEISKKFQGYKTPSGANPFQREPEEFFFLLPEKNIEDINESDFENKLQTESGTIVENLFKQIYESIIRFSSGLSRLIGESFATYKKESLQKIRDAIVQFFGAGGSLYDLEKWCNAALESVAQSLKQETNIFRPEQIIENRKLCYVPGLKELCRILLKLKYWQRFSSYKYALLGIFVFLSLLSLIFIPEVLHLTLTLKNTTVLVIISAILSLILTFVIRSIVLQHFRKNAYAKLEELVNQYDRLKKELSDTLIKMFQDFAILHFMTKINIYIRKILSDIQETCYIYRRVFERKEVTPFSIGQSQLIRYCKGKSIPSEQMEEKIKEDFCNNIKSIFVNFLNISSEFELESCIANFLQNTEEKNMEHCRSSLKSDNFDLEEGALRKLIEETTDYISCLVSGEIEKEKNVSVDRFLCLPSGIRVDIHGISHLHSINWERNESILSTVVASGVKIGSIKNGNKKSH